MNYPHYSEYKNSGLPMVGNVPSHWIRTALKFLGNYQNGYPFKPEDWGAEGLPIIRIAQLTGDSEPNCYSGSLDKRVFVENGDLLFSWSANIDSFIWQGGPAWLNQHIFKVLPSIEANKKYLYYLIKHIAPKLAEFDAHGSTMRHIKKESLGERVFVPSVFEQYQISTFLDRETAKIDDLTKAFAGLITTLKEKRQAVISQAVTKGLDPSVPMKDSGIEWVGKIPASWSFGSLSYFATLSTGSTPDRSQPHFWNGEIPWVKTGEIRYATIVETEECITPEGLASCSVNLAPAGTLLMALYGQGVTRGRVAILGIPATFNQACAAIQVGSLVNVRFLQAFFEFSYPFIREIGNETTQMNLNLEFVRKIRIAAPPIEEQKAIADFLEIETGKLDSLIDEASRSMVLLQERRTALISAAVTGKIDVRGLVNVVEEEKILETA